MTQAEVQQASESCDAAFQRYTVAATETHHMLSKLSANITLDERIAVGEQRLLENDRQYFYAEARKKLFDVIFPSAAALSTKPKIVIR